MYLFDFLELDQFYHPRMKHSRDIFLKILDVYGHMIKKIRSINEITPTIIDRPFSVGLML